MSDVRSRQITQEIQHVDRELYCVRDQNGMRHIMRKSVKPVHYEWNDSDTLTVLVDNPEHIMSLTDTWTMVGRPVDWGTIPIVKKLREIDTWNSEAPVNHLEDGWNQVEEAKRRDFRNETEAFLKEFRPQFAKAFNDVRTANMDMKQDKRRIKDGNL